MDAGQDRDRPARDLQPIHVESEGEQHIAERIDEVARRHVLRVTPARPEDFAFSRIERLDHDLRFVPSVDPQDPSEREEHGSAS